MAVALEKLAAQLRVDSIRCTTAAGSGHPTSSMSAADLMAVLLAKYLRIDWGHPKAADNDHLVFSKGHASPLLYAMFKAAGAITDAELMTNRQFGSRLQGHPNPRVLPYVDVATGSLGQGIGVATGLALAGQKLEGRGYRVWTLLGDSEMAEGSVWEAFDKAGFYSLENLIAIIDVNRLGQRGPTELGWDTAAYAERARSFGWHAIEIDGHDLAQITRAYEEAITAKGKPTCIVAKTQKGHGVSFLADQNGWHGKALQGEQGKKAIAELGGESNLTVHGPKPQVVAGRAIGRPKALELPRYTAGDAVATRKAYGDALVALGAADPRVVVLDGEVGNSTYSEEFQKAYADRFFEMFIAEQQMVAAAMGLAVRGWKPFASTFAAFLTRAYDHVRMAAVSGLSLSLCGSHAGVSIGEDGPSQMGLEDLSMMRAVFGSTVLYPSDPNQAAQLVGEMASTPGITYLRTTREKTPVLYDAAERFRIGGSKEVRHSDRDQVAIVGAGITLHEALKAHARLKDAGIKVRVIDLYSVKPLDTATLQRALVDCGGRMVVAEDHHGEGGIGEAVLAALAQAGGPMPRLKHLAVREVAGSGKPEELLKAARIDSEAIAAAVRALL